MAGSKLDSSNSITLPFTANWVSPSEAKIEVSRREKQRETTTNRLSMASFPPELQGWPPFQLQLTSYLLCFRLPIRVL